MPICRNCGVEFFKKQYKIGYIDQCETCSRQRSKDIHIKYVGRPGATLKGANIEIFRTDLENTRRMIRRENAIGMTANIPISSAAQVAAQERWKDGEEE